MISVTYESNYNWELKISTQKGVLDSVKSKGTCDYTAPTTTFSGTCN